MDQPGAGDVDSNKPEGTGHPQAPRRVRVVVRQPQNQDGTEEETRIYEDVLIDPDGHMHLCSHRPPEDVFSFGLPLGPRESFIQVRHIRLTTPSERSITRDREDGLCIYCQLLLLPDAPEYAAHQPCMGLLIRNWDRCQLCTLINVSIGRANPDWKARYEAGLMDVASPDTRIWVRSGKFDKHSLIVATVGDHPSRPNVRGTPIVWTTSKDLGSLNRRMIWQPYSASEQSEASARLDVIREWLGTCQSKHTACNVLEQSRQGGRPLPTRVLSISPQDAPIPFTIQLHEASDGESAPYIALSHCWGRSGPLRTLKSNIERHKREIPFDALPLSFKDVVVKAWYLGFRYLWIDSLCIIQDDNEDWEAEAARMAAVYSNATLTFAATEAADPSQGCCPLYTRAMAIPLEGDDNALVRFQDHLGLNDGDAALNTRGWAFQEAALSRRMVCFDDNQLLWKCTSRHESEDGLRVVSKATPYTGDWNVWACLTQLGSGEPSYAFWYRIMEDYSGRQFTFEKDKLPALAGIVEVFKEHVNDAPLVGLWRQDMISGLLWRADKPTEQVFLQGGGVVPSWSWISVSRRVSWRRLLFTIEPEDQLEVISAEVDWAGRPMTSPISWAALKVRGRLKKVKVVIKNASLVYLHAIDEPPSSLSKSSKAPRTPANGQEEETLLGPEILGYCHLDLAKPVGPDIWCLEVQHGLQRDEPPDSPRNGAHQVLLLEPVNESQSEFRRAGVGCLWRHSYRSGAGVTGNAVRETFLGVPRQTVTIL